MSAKQPENLALLRPLDLGDGLILRRSTAKDADNLAEFNVRVHSPREEGSQPDQRIGAWTHDLLNGNHPTFKVDDFTIVEEKASGKIVSSANLISQTWAYAGIPFGMGRPELVGTDPDYRNRGLVRKQFEVLHAWSAARGEQAQIITGIPFFYRLFGYEMAPNLGGGRNVLENQVKALKNNQPELYTIRTFTEADLHEWITCYSQLEKRGPLSCLRNSAEWKYELLGKSHENVNRFEGFMIEDPAGQVVGALAIPFYLWGDTQAMIFYELKPGNSYLMVTPSVLRFLWQTGKQRQTEKEPLRSIGLRMGEEHPAYTVLDPLHTIARPPYAFYIRVADLPGFLGTIAPALEKRLACSPFSGHSGEIKLSFYRDGLRLRIEHGRIAGLDPDPTLFWEDADAAFPDQTFLQLLFQYRSLSELREQRADIWAKQEAFALLDVFCPRQACDVWFQG